jgi:hypothetical protein
MVRITSFYVTGGVGRIDDVFWAAVKRSYYGVSAKVAVFFGDAEARLEDTLDESDEWERVAEQRLPNYVCVALAKWRLTGEKTSCR